MHAPTAAPGTTGTPGPTDMVELLTSRAAAHPDRVAYRFLGTDGEETESLTFAGLDRRARAVAALLRTRTSPGDRVLLLQPTGADWVAALFGCFYANVIAVPAPHPGGGADRRLQRLTLILKDAQPSVTLTTADVLQQIESRRGAPFGHGLATAEIPPAPGSWEPEPAGAATPALLQYTSGSTSAPKGVVVTHHNFLHNLGCVSRMADRAVTGVPPAGQTLVSWLPLFHDMGLAIALYAVYRGGTSVLMSPLSFLMSPVTWLRAMADHRAQISSAPNFAYDLCAARVTPQERDALDLSHWKLALNGAEPVRAETLTRFTDHFAPSGLPRATLTPCYGLAEATVFVSGVRGDNEPASALRLTRDALHRGIVRVAPDGADSVRVVSCGRPPEELTVRIVDPDRLTPQEPGHVGEIWVAGDSVAAGYWQQPLESEATFGARLADTGEGPFLRTGDLGFLHEGRLYVAGRIKDLVIVDGRNHHPQDIELTAERSHPAIRENQCAAFQHDTGGEARLVVAVEVREGDRTGREVTRAVRRAVAEEHQITVASVAVLRPGSLPRTTSGKLQRQRCRDLFLSGELTTW
ncbi:fatty acyl-AMP ligase [Streptomyces sp. URMC 127]|uniref:fatty acyl-AMP ligase n=1 Tax=Streptomyces sp. URMC 127 TaxID=3423402 RepID=UPI003F1BED03